MENKSRVLRMHTFIPSLLLTMNKIVTWYHKTNKPILLQVALGQGIFITASQRKLGEWGLNNGITHLLSRSVSIYINLMSCMVLGRVDRSSEQE